MIEWFVIPTLVAAAAAAAFAAVACVLMFRMRKDSLDRLAVAGLLRAEGDAIRSGMAASAENVRAAVVVNARDLRQELGNTLAHHHGAALDVVTKLSDSLLKQVDAFGVRLEAANKLTEKRVDEIGVKLNADIGQMGESAAANREALRGVIEKKLDTSVETHAAAAVRLREELNSGFDRLRQRVIETLTETSNVQRERLDGAKEAIEALTVKQADAGEQLRQVVEGRLDAIRGETAAKLDEMRHTVDEKLHATLETRLGESFSRVVEQLTRVSEGIGEMKTLAANVGDLRNVLTNVKVRGAFGEVQLERLIEDFLTPDQYVRNAQIKDNSGERVEFAIRCPLGDAGEDMLLPIDAKFPREDYERLLQAGESGDVKLVAHFRGQLHLRIKACARDIKVKYIDPPRTHDYAVLFLPTEGLYSEVTREPDLIQHLYREHNVLVAGPMNLAGILNSFRLNFRSRALAKRSAEVWNVLSAVRTEFGRYNEVVTKLGKQLQTASNSVESLGQRTRAMDRKLRTVEMLPDDGSAQKLLGFDGENVDIDDGEAPSRTTPQSEIVLSDVDPVVRTGGATDDVADSEYAE